MVQQVPLCGLVVFDIACETEKGTVNQEIRLPESPDIINTSCFTDDIDKFIVEFSSSPPFSSSIIFPPHR